MGYTLTVDIPNLGPNEEVQIPGLGTFKNGGTYEVDDELAERYRVAHTTVVPEFDENNNLVANNEEQGPTLLEAAKSMYGIEVKTAGPPKAKAEETKKEEEGK